MTECESLLEEFSVPKNVLEHSEKVRLVANAIAKKISKKKEMNLEAVDKAALLHDFMKLHCVNNDCRHAIEAGKILRERGYPEFAELVKLHGLEEVNNFGAKTPVEAKIIWYADKRVNHSTIVTLGERYDYLREKYGSSSEQKMSEINSTWKNALKVEEELLSLSGFERDYLFGDC